MQQVWVLFVVALLATAGCLSSTDKQAVGDADDLDPNIVELPTEATRIDLVLDQCHAFELFVPQPSAQLAPYVPDGFEVAVNAGQGLVILGGLACDGADDLERMFVAIQVNPTDPALEGDGVGNYFWEPEHVVVPSNAGGRAYTALGSNHTLGTRVEVAVGTVSSSMRALLDGGSHVIEMIPGGRATPGLGGALGTFREYSAAENGYVYLEATFGAHDAEATSASLATFTTAEDTVSREILGPTGQSPAGAFSPIVYDAAVIGFIPWPTL